MSDEALKRIREIQATMGTPVKKKNTITVELTPLEAQKVRSCIMLQIRDREMENMALDNYRFPLQEEDVDKYDKNEEIIEELLTIMSKFIVKEGDVQ